MTDSSSSGGYDVAFNAGNRDPLAIDGEKSIENSRAMKDKKFPKLFGPKSKYVRVKNKCKKFPYCTQGPDAIEILEIKGMKEALEIVSEKHGVDFEDLKRIVTEEIKK
jgi:hypothetical protein